MPCEFFLYRPDELVYRPDELVYRPDKIIIRPDELYIVRTNYTSSRPIIYCPDDVKKIFIWHLRAAVPLVIRNIILKKAHRWKRMSLERLDGDINAPIVQFRPWEGKVKPRIDLWQILISRSETLRKSRGQG